MRNVRLKVITREGKEEKGEEKRYGDRNKLRTEVEEEIKGGVEEEKGEGMGVLREGGGKIRD